MSHASIIVAVPGNVEEENLEEAIAYEMEPFSEHEWFGDGSRWDSWVIGGRWQGYHFGGRNYIRRSEIDNSDIQDYREAQARSIWNSMQEDLIKRPDFVEIVWGSDSKLSKEEFLQKKRLFSAYAFLINRTWHENERMGWWGSSAKTECSIDDPSYEGSCMFKNEEMKSKIITYGFSEEKWRQDYEKRFITPRTSDTWLVTVDYHV